METQLTQKQWLDIPHETRLALRRIFEIPCSSPTQTILGTYAKTESDGCTEKDRSVLTVEAMQKYLGNYNIADFFALLSEVLNRITVEQREGLSILKREQVDEENPIYKRWEEELVRMRNESEAINLVLKLKHLVWEKFPQPMKTNAEPVQKGTIKGTKKRS